MIGLLLLAQAAGIDGTALDALPRQQLPARGCAAFLWSAGTSHQLVALAGADPAQLRLSLDGRTLDLPRAEAEGSAGYGFAASTHYRLGDIVAVLDLSVRTDANLTDGAAVPQATLRIERAGQDGVAMPLGGLIGCAPAPAAGQSR